MLDNGTKKRIDFARDILVGKVPDPKAKAESNLKRTKWNKKK